MAYMFAINTKCQQDGCAKPATHRVCNNINDTMGTYCKKHATARVESLNMTETRLKRAADPPAQETPK